MVDPDNTNQDNAPLADGDDTKTRKTVRLKPSAITPAGINLSKPALSDPLSGRDTDTGNLEVLEDTQTRKTVKLKPLSPPIGGPAGINIQPNCPPPTPGAAAKDGVNTQTRKTIVLKPTAVSPASLNVDSATDGNDTKTRKTVKLKPSMAAPTSVKLESGATAAASDAESSDTIKITRPPRPMGAPADPSKATMVLPGATAATGSPLLKPVGAAPALKHAAPAGIPVNPMEAKPKLQVEDAPLTLKKPEKSTTTTTTTSAAAEPAGKKAPAPKLKKKTDADSEPSKVYLIMAVITLLCVIACATITTVQYLNIHEQQNIELPGLPQAK